MHLAILYEEVAWWADAKTGQPFEILAYRGQTKSRFDFARGVFYSPHIDVAQQYGDVIKKHLKFRNPLVVRGTTDALKYLITNGALDQKSIMFGGCAGNPVGERVIAKGARKLGIDGIIYIDGLDEIVDLR